jgi:hypothetical protein
MLDGSEGPVAGTFPVNMVSSGENMLESIHTNR